MKIEINDNDKINMNLTLARSLIGDAVLNERNNQEVAKKCLMVYGLIKQILILLNVDLNEK